MSRVAAWKKKKSARWQTTREELSQTTLYLVNRLGPTVFSVRDDGLTTYKVTIGNPHTCTCSRLEVDELCVHQLYCLIKVLRVNELHPLVYQLGVTDGEAEQILSGQCSDDSASRKRVENLSAAARARRKARIKAGEDPASPDKDTNNNNVERQLLSDGCAAEGEADLCPICQDEMNKDQALTWCRSGCGNNVHAKCMQTFAQYKISSHSQVECPLCRAEWNIALLKDDVRGKATLKQSCLPCYCMSCHLPIRTGKLHRCLECSQKRTFAALRPKITDNISNNDTPGASTLSTPGATPRSGLLSGLPVGSMGGVGGGGTSVLTTPAQFALQAHQQATMAAERAERQATLVTSMKRTADYCERCFGLSIDKAHATHHFVTSAADAKTDDAVMWEVIDNPIQDIRNISSLYPTTRPDTDGPVPGTDGGLSDDLRALQERELTMDDYSMLLELDNTPTRNVAEHIVSHLPKSQADPALERGGTGANAGIGVGGRAAQSEEAAQSLRTEYYLTQGQLSPLRKRPQGPCWCRVSALAAQGMNISEIAKSTLRVLPCKHLAHDFCIQTAMEKALNEEATPYHMFKCKHADCRHVIFPSLNRARKKARPKQSAIVTASKEKAAALNSTGTAASTGAGIPPVGATGAAGMLNFSINGGNIGNFGIANPGGFGALVASSFGSEIVPAPNMHAVTAAAGAGAGASGAIGLVCLGVGGSGLLTTGSQPSLTLNPTLTSPALSSGAHAATADFTSAGASVSSTFTGIEGTSVGSTVIQRGAGGAASGRVLKGRAPQRSALNAKTRNITEKPTYSQNDIHHPANAMRGRQRYHESELVGMGTLQQQAPESQMGVDLTITMTMTGVASNQTSRTVTPITNTKQGRCRLSGSSTAPNTNAGSSRGGSSSKASNARKPHLGRSGSSSRTTPTPSAIADDSMQFSAAGTGLISHIGDMQDWGEMSSTGTDSAAAFGVVNRNTNVGADADNAEIIDGDGGSGGMLNMTIRGDTPKNQAVHRGLSRLLQRAASGGAGSSSSRGASNSNSGTRLTITESTMTTSTSGGGTNSGINSNTTSGGGDIAGMIGVGSLAPISSHSQDSSGSGSAAVLFPRRGKKTKGKIMSGSASAGAFGSASSHSRANGNTGSNDKGRQGRPQSPVTEISLPALSSTKLAFPSRARLDMNLQPSGLGRSSEVDFHLQRRYGGAEGGSPVTSLTMAVGLGWMAGAEQAQDYDDADDV